MQRFLILLFLFIFLTPVANPAYGKLLPQAKAKTGTKVVAGAGIAISPRIRADRRALLVNFGNLANASSVSYTLVYEQNGQQEGAGGSVDPSLGNSASRELLFGTCSSGVCRYHSGIRNARLEVTTGLKSGKTSIRRYRLRV